MFFNDLNFQIQVLYKKSVMCYNHQVLNSPMLQLYYKSSNFLQLKSKAFIYSNNINDILIIRYNENAYI